MPQPINQFKSGARTALLGLVVGIASSAQEFMPEENNNSSMSSSEEQNSNLFSKIMLMVFLSIGTGFTVGYAGAYVYNSCLVRYQNRQRTTTSSSASTAASNAPTSPYQPVTPPPLYKTNNTVSLLEKGEHNNGTIQGQTNYGSFSPAIN
jgi:hypothetical protein